MVEVKITVHNSVEEMNMPQMERAELAADDWSKEFLFKACYRFVGKEYVDLNTLFAVFSKGEESISKQNFKDTIIPKKSGVTDSEIDMFVRECEPFQRYGYMTREEFMSIMRVPLKRAQQEYRIRKQELGEQDDEEQDEEDVDLRRATHQSYESRDTSRSKKHSERKSGRRSDRQHTEEDRKSSHRSSTKDGAKSYRDFSRVDDIKSKMKEFILKDKISLQLFYEYIDKDGDKRLDNKEFVDKLEKINIDITKDEAHTLFNYCDKNRSGEITYKEFALACGGKLNIYFQIISRD